jgi:replicative DNA helicase
LSGDDASPGAAVHEVRRVSAAARLDAISLARQVASENLEQGVPRVSTGWPRLDAALGGGFAVPSLNVLGAAPKSGKSTWGQKIAVHHAEAGGVAYVLDLENGRRRYARQILCRFSGLGPKEVAEAHRDRFSSRAAVERWAAAKERLRALSGSLFAEFAPPKDLVARLTDVRRLADDRPLLVVMDSLQKLPGDLDERRAVVDAWVRLFERLRHELDVVFLVISEIKRSQRGDYQANESAFKESGGIEYSADLAMTLTRPRADEDEEAGAVLRVELARDCDEDPRGDVATYVPVFPAYELEEREPLERAKSGRRGPRATKRDAAADFLREQLTGGPVKVEDLERRAKGAGISRPTLHRAREVLAIGECTLELRKAWRLAP